MNKEISVEEAAILRNNHAEAIFLDVREDHELDICRIEGALHIPMGQVPERYHALDSHAPLVVFCHHGMRSLNVVQFLEAKGFKNALNMRGGIHAWAHEVDREMPHY
jgi:rhodanese-related sulfurtransferase